MIIRKLRLERAWSQEQLAALSGLSVRTIQRIERGQNPGLDSLKALAAVFDIDVATLTPEPAMTPTMTNEPPQADQPTLSKEERKALIYVRDIKGFYAHLLSYAIVIPILVVCNFYIQPDNLWSLWPAAGWGLGVLMHGLAVFEKFRLYSPDWEKKQVEKYLQRARN